MAKKLAELMAIVAMILGLTLGPALVSRAASLYPDSGNAAPTAFVGGRSSGY